MSEESTSRATHQVCRVDDLPLGEARQFVVGDKEVCVAHCRDGFRAISDWCSHERFSLADGYFDPDACEIECPYHGSVFSLVSGEALTLPATEPVEVYDVEVDGSFVVVVE